MSLRIIRRWKERGIQVWLLACALISVATTAGIMWVLASESARFFSHVSPLRFFFGTRWAPLLEPRGFGCCH
jgi:phosphate transport system permease protein